MRRPSIKFSEDPEQWLADVDVGHGVIIEFVRVRDSEWWEVWGVRIDGQLYREPRDMQGENLQAGEFRDMLSRKFSLWLDARAQLREQDRQAANL